MVPMRSVPHWVICLLGLDDGAFPRAGVDDGDDARLDPRVGERDPRSGPPAAARRAVCGDRTPGRPLLGADARTGARRLPAVLLGELLDAVAATAGPDAVGRVVVRHPLQPFDARNFTAGALGTRGRSADRVELAGCRAAPREGLARRSSLARLASPRDDDRRTRRLRQPGTSGEAVPAAEVGLPVSDIDDDPADALPVALDALQRWAVGDRLLRDRLAGLDVACRRARSMARRAATRQLGTLVLAEASTTSRSWSRRAPGS